MDIVLAHFAKHIGAVEIRRAIASRYKYQIWATDPESSPSSRRWIVLNFDSIEEALEAVEKCTR